MTDFDKIKEVGYVTPWCKAYVVGDKKTWFYEEAFWSNGNSYSSLDNPRYGDVLKERSQLFNEAPKITQKMYVQDVRR